VEAALGGPVLLSGGACDDRARVGDGREVEVLRARVQGSPRERYNRKGEEESRPSRERERERASGGGERSTNARALDGRTTPPRARHVGVSSSSST
jgi:hypothetical protein